MKKWTMAVLASVLIAGIAGSAVAQGGDAGASGFVTQGELAQRLVERLGLWRVLPARPTNAECFGVLMAAGITPSEDGWQEDEPVTVASLVRVLVQALGGNALVPEDQRGDPEAWMSALRSLLEDMELIETVQGALSVLSPDEGIRNVIEWFTVSADELVRQHVSLSQITEILTIPTPPRRRDVTPDAPEEFGDVG